MAVPLRKRALPRFDHSSSQSTRIFSNFGTLSSWIFCSSWANFGRDRRWWCGFSVQVIKVRIEWFCCFRNTPRGRDSCGVLGGPRGGILIFSPKRVFFIEFVTLWWLDIKRNAHAENVQNLDQIRVDFEKLWWKQAYPLKKKSPRTM